MQEKNTDPPLPLIQPAQSVRKFGMYVGRLSPGETGEKRGARDLVRGRLPPAQYPLSTCHSPTAASAPPRSNFQTRRARGFENIFF